MSADDIDLARSQRKLGILLAIAIVWGGSIAYMDSRPTWDDTGITVTALIVSTGILGIIEPKRAWLWALAVGIWTPLAEIPHSESSGSLVALLFAFVGAYFGMLIRKGVKAMS